MARLEIACPECGQRLKIPDRSLLGRKARCGRCQQTFVLEETTSRGESRLAERSGAGSLDAPIEFSDLAKFRAQRVPHGTAAHHNRSKPGSRPLPGEAAGRTEGHAEGQASAPAPEHDLEESESIDLFPVVDVEEGVFSRRWRNRSTASRRTTMMAGSTALMLIVGAAAWFFSSRKEGTTGAQPSGKPSGVVVRAAGEHSARGAQEGDRPVSPTHGRPLSLRYVPMEARIVIHLRPADLWKPEGAGAEWRACLGPLGDWMETQLKSRCLVEPTTIDEALFALIPASRETFDVATVVRTTREFKRSEILDKIGGDLVDRPVEHYVSGDSAYLLADSRTIAIAPRELAESMLESTGNATASEGLQALLPRTDRDRHFTLVAEWEDVQLGMNGLVPSLVRPLADGVVDFFGEHVETIAASVHLGEASTERDLFIQVLARNRLSRSPPHLRDDLRKQLAQLPATVLALVQRTNPRTVGEKKLVGRLPVMMKVVAESAVLNVERRIVSLECHLPERAGPNLALASHLAWAQTTRPVEDRPSPSGRGDAPESGAAAAIAERLNKPIDVDFRDDFLYVAIEYIGDEIGVTFQLDGQGMKRAGVTQNEKQKFAMRSAPAIAVLDRILTPRKLVLIVDEQKKSATITSAEEAADRKLSPFPLATSGGE